MTNAPSRRQLRNHYRKLRRQLTGADQLRHSAAICRHFFSSPWWLHGRVIGGYAAADGEVELAPLFARLHRQGKILALPVVEDSRGTMRFYRYRPGDPLLTNRFGIAEPGRASRPVRRLDLILAPLVAFDAAGSRLGFGGGYYDRFAARHRCPMIGIAHDLQRADELPVDVWDQRLSGVITEVGWQVFE